ncbi:MAG TPA: hypothetical protein VIM67_00425 [Terriglobus sp.]
MSGITLNSVFSVDTEAALYGLVQAFEVGTLPKVQWTHAAHVAMGSHYVFLLGEADALTTMRRRVRVYNEAVGTINSTTSGYHETLTRFWIAVLARLYVVHPTTLELAFVQQAVSLYGGRRDLHGAFYEFDVVKSVEARQAWIAPDHWPDNGIL